MQHNEACMYVWCDREKDQLVTTLCIWSACSVGLVRLTKILLEIWLCFVPKVYICIAPGTNGNAVFAVLLWWSIIAWQSIICCMNHLKVLYYPCKCPRETRNCSHTADELSCSLERMYDLCGHNNISVTRGSRFHPQPMLQILIHLPTPLPVSEYRIINRIAGELRLGGTSGGL